MTVIGRKPGYVPGLHHFGVDVDNIEEAIRRIKAKYPEIAVLKRPSNRPFATYGAHDPEGNYLISPKRHVEPQGRYTIPRGSSQTEQQREPPRRIHHIKLRVMNAPASRRSTAICST